MHVMGYLVTIMNLQSFAGRGGTIKDIAVNVGQVANIENGLIREHVFQPNDFRDTGFVIKGKVGKYISQKVRDYIFYRNVPATDEGVVLTFTYKGDNEDVPEDATGRPTNEALSYYIQKEKDDSAKQALVEYMNNRIQK